MCKTCDILLNQNLNIGTQNKTAKGKIFTIIKRNNSLITIETKKRRKRMFHEHHLNLCLHWLIKKNKIYSVAGSTAYSVRLLIGKNGAFVQCELCDRSPAYIWGILNSLPGVKRNRNTLYM